MLIRPFEDRDYPRMVEIANRIFPTAPRSLDDVRRRDGQWNHDRFDLYRVVAAGLDGEAVGWGQLNHQPHQFDPRAYRIGIQVDPLRQGQGVGGRIYTHLIDALRERGAVVISARARADMASSVDFLRRRGFEPIEETLESTLPVATFDPARAIAAEARLARDGITISTLAREGLHDPAVLRRVHALYLACLRDIPTARPVTEISFQQFVAREIQAPNMIPEAFFLVVASGEYIAMCDFVRDPGLPGALAGRMTGCLPAWRGKGIVTALKLHMARYALEHGYDEIRTWNSAANASMVRINASVGFVRRVTWVTFQRDPGDVLEIGGDA